MPNRRKSMIVPLLLAGMALTLCAQSAKPLDESFARSSMQPVDEEYTSLIRKYTTDPKFSSSLVDDLPASKTVPTPMKTLGVIAGAPDVLPYAEDVAKYFRLLAASSPRVKVVSIGRSEEGREMIAAAIADESLLAHQPENNARLAQLADPRTIGMDDTKARALVAASFPVYYITGTIHSPETGAPTALMELAYRLAVDDAPYIRYIRSHLIVLITPVVEVDGRDRMVDLYKWHKAHPDLQYPRLEYAGHYVLHDNNRDAMGLTLNLTRNVLNAYLDWHALVLHDLHESEPFLYDNTVGDGPYNAWIDPTLADEWAELGWNNVAQLQGFGMPGVYTHGNFDTWSPGYLMFLAGMHNGISRLYETFGNGGADTVKRILRPEDYSRTWFRQNPPLPIVTWSQRDNNNYEESGLLSTLAYFSQHTQHFLENFYLKSKRSIEKPNLDGPAAYVLPASVAERNRQLQLIRILRMQHVEVSLLTDERKQQVPAPKRGDKPVEETFPAGSVIVRMDQPYSRIADALLDRQYWAPDDPQKHPYDDTGWSFSQLFNLKVVRVPDKTILSAKMEPLGDLATLTGKLTGTGSIAAIENTGQSTLLSLLYPFKEAKFTVAEKPFDAEGKHFGAGTLLVSGAGESELAAALARFSLDATRLAAMPMVATHAVTAPRIALMHTWLGTQNEGWWRNAFDSAGVPYAYISTQKIAAEKDLRAKYDVIVFAPVGRASAQSILEGMPMYGNPLPWEKTALTPNIGTIDSTPDTRPGLGYDGLTRLREFVEHGGLLITCEDTAQFAIDMGLAPGVSLGSKGDARVVGSVLDSVFVANASPIAYGFGKSVPVMSADGMTFNISNTVGGNGGMRVLMDPYADRPTGRGSVDDDDVVQGRAPVEAEPLPKPKAWEARPLNEEQMRNNISVIPVAERPEVILRFAEAKGLLLSGLLDKAGPIAEHAIVVDAHLGQGNVLLFANRPIYRGETVGTYPLVFNAILNYDHLRTEPAAKK
jgi:hypothetical protein